MALGTLSPEQFAEQQQLNRQQQMAQALMQQGMQQPQGQMVSGRYVAPSFFQNILPIAQMYAGKSMAEQGDKQALAMAQRLRAGESQAMVDFNKIRQGTPAVEGGIYGADNKLTMQTTPDMFDANMQLNPQFRQVAPTAAVAPNPQAAFEKLYSDPRATQRLRDLAFNKMTAEPESFTLPEGATRVARQPDGTFKVVASGGEKTSPEYTNFLKAQADPINPFRGGFTDYQTMIKKAGAPTTSFNANNKFTGGFAEKASGGAYDMYTAALNAPKQIENSKRTIELVNSGALTGTGADIALQAAKIFNVAGADNKDTISKTELLVANRGKSLLGSIKQSGLAGSQGLTEGERKFLTQAEGGTITLDAETLKAMAGLEIKMAVDSQKKWNAQAARMDPEILKVTGASPVEVYTGIGTIDVSNPLLNPRR